MTKKIVNPIFHVTCSLYFCRPLQQNNDLVMLIINVKEDESIDRALKRYKRKYQSVGVIKELRKRKNFTKPSVERRNEILNAKYRQEVYGNL